jgi:hypothetical protein
MDLHRFLTDLHRFLTDLHRFLTDLHRFLTDLHRFLMLLHHGVNHYRHQHVINRQVVRYSKSLIKNKILIDILVMNILHTKSNINPACLPTPNPSSPGFASRFRADVVRLTEASNTHKHTDTCYKYCKANQGDKKICRTRMPRKLIPVSTIDPETGHISMRRSDPWINNFNEYLIAACRSNMDIKFIWSGSDAKALVYYITDYVTKMSLSFHDTFALVQKSLTSVKHLSDQTNGVTDPGYRGSWRSPEKCYLYYRHYNIIMNSYTVTMFFLLSRTA